MTVTAGALANVRARKAPDEVRPDLHTTRPTRRSTVVVMMVLVLAVFLLYWPTVHYQFVYDDFQIVVGNRSIRLPTSEWWRYFVPGQGGYRPLRNLTYAIDYQIGGMDPASFRRTNILLHAGGTLAAFGLASALGLGVTGAAVTAALFAVHPVQTESVTYVSGRRDVLCGVLYLAGMLCYVRFRRRGNARWLAGACVASLAALLAKEMAASLPLICLLYEWCYRRGHWGRRVVAVALVLLGAVVATLAIFYAGVIIRQARDMPWYGGGVEGNFATVARVWVHYFGVLVYPRTLIADYSGRYFPVSTGILERSVLASLAAIAAWIATAIRLRRRWPVVSFALLWLPLSLLPVSHVIPHGELLADHYLYIPAFGLCLLAGIFIEALAERRGAERFVAAALVAGMIGGLGWRTMTRQHDWADSLTFYTRLREDNQYSPRVYLGLGNEYVQLRQPRLAIMVFGQGLRLAPDSPWLHLNRGAALQQLGEYEAAKQDYQRAMELGLNTRPLQTNLGLLYAATGRYREARRALRAARRLRGASGEEASVYTNMALLLRGEGDLDRALRLLRRAQRLAPKNSGIALEIEKTERRRRQSGRAEQGGSTAP